ncbi:hypothetical protein FAZ19_00185 [Sphingobacterium alkalisoli]|uniref:Uncharacterized protein n=1 Tax=Sphingobacterium alkalisoli TaxID=1874115 RepID=A0A4V5LYS6_9SPHI|nr:hypothetical protein [Sphingobacterium alkalisoli]TJY67719.1 hypothetical protein FAZ19_00185 [Sphingobacterium alkalisoli]
MDDYANIRLPYKFNGSETIEAHKTLSFNLYYMLSFNKIYNNVDPFCLVIDNVNQVFMFEHFFKAKNVKIFCFVDMQTILDEKEKVLSLNPKCIILSPNDNCLSLIRQMGLENIIHIFPYYRAADIRLKVKIKYKFIWVSHEKEIELHRLELIKSKEKIIFCGTIDLNKIPVEFLLKDNLFFLNYRSIDLLYNLAASVDKVFCPSEYVALCTILILGEKNVLYTYENLSDLINGKFLDINKADIPELDNDKDILCKKLLEILHY